MSQTILSSAIAFLSPYSTFGPWLRYDLDAKLLIFIYMHGKNLALQHAAPKAHAVVIISNFYAIFMAVGAL